MRVAQKLELRVSFRSTLSRFLSVKKSAKNAVLTEYGENLFLQCEVYDKYCILRVSPEVGGDWRNPLHYPHVSLNALPQKC